MLPLDTIYNEDCLQGMRRMGDGTVDCRSLRPALPAGEPRDARNKGQEIKGFNELYEL